MVPQELVTGSLPSWRRSRKPRMRGSDSVRAGWLSDRDKVQGLQVSAILSRLRRSPFVCLPVEDQCAYRVEWRPVVVPLAVSPLTPPTARRQDQETEAGVGCGRPLAERCRQPAAGGHATPQLGELSLGSTTTRGPAQLLALHG